MAVILSSSRFEWPYSRPANLSQAASFWCYCTVSGTTQMPLTWASPSLGAIVGFWFGHPTLGPLNWLLSTSNTGGNISSSTQAQNLGRWVHVFGVWQWDEAASATDMAVYLDGNFAGRGVADNKANIPSALSNFNVGGLNRSGTDFPLLAGLMGEIAVWEGFTGFSALDLARLAAGVAPWRIHTPELTRYIPARGSLNCEINGAPTATSGATIILSSADPPMVSEARARPDRLRGSGPFLFRRRFWPAVPSAPAVGNVPAAYHHRQLQGMA